MILAFAGPDGSLVIEKLAWSLTVALLADDQG